MSSPASALVWINGVLAASPHSGLVPLVVVGMVFMNFWLSFQVGAARRKHRIPYPTLYAVPGTLRDYSPDREKLASAAAASSSTSLSSGEAGGDSLSNVVSEADAFAFNCIQRGHQNTLENISFVIALMLVTWPAFPLPSAICGAIWVVGRVLYMLGYARSPKLRMWGAIGYVGLLGLLGLALAEAAYFYGRTAAY
jgi:glutathione S-transferase